MAKHPPLAAIDSSALLCLFLNRKEDRNKALAVQSLVQDGSYQIIIPSLVGVEVVAAIPMRMGKQASPIRNSAIASARAFLDRKSMILAGQLGTEKLVKPPDAAIVATAVSAGCDHIFTYDQDLIKKCDGRQGIEVAEPPASMTLPINFSD